MITDDLHPHLTLFLKIWVPVGPLVGILAGHYLSELSKGKHRKEDKIQDEVRELLIAFNAVVPAYTIWARTIHSSQFPMPNVDWDNRVGDLLNVYTEKSVAFYTTLNNRQFIGPSVATLRLRKRWEDAMSEYEVRFDESLMEKRVLAINKDISSIKK